MAFAIWTLVLTVAIHSASAASTPSNACLEKMIASKGTTPSRHTCTSCYDDNLCCPSVATAIECSSSVSSLARCEPSGTDECSINARRMWIAVFVPLGFLLILCVLCYCFCSTTKSKVEPRYAMSEGEPEHTANEACFEPRGSKKIRRGAFIQVRV